MTDDRAERLFGDDFRHNDVFGGVLEGRAGCGQTGDVSRVHVASTGEVLLLAFGVGGDGNRVVADVVDTEEVGEVQFGRGTGLDTNGRTIELTCRRNAQISPNHETLTIVVIHSDEIETKIVVTGEGPGGVADQNVDFASGQRGEAGLGGQRNKLNRLRVAECRSSDCPAQRDVEALHIAT